MKFFGTNHASGEMEAILQGQEFIIRIDHKSVAYLTQKNLHSYIQRNAMTRLMQLQFKVVYRRGQENVDFICSSISIFSPASVDSGAPQFLFYWFPTQQLLIQLAIHSPDNQGYTLERALITYKNKLWVAQNSALQTKIITTFHPSPLWCLGHLLENQQIISMELLPNIVQIGWCPPVEDELSLPLVRS